MASLDNPLPLECILFPDKYMTGAAASFLSSVVLELLCESAGTNSSRECRFADLRKIANFVILLCRLFLGDVSTLISSIASLMMIAITARFIYKVP